MGDLLIDILVFLGLLFLAMLILAPVFYFIDKEKADEAENNAAEDQVQEKSEG